MKVGIRVAAIAMFLNGMFASAAMAETVRVGIIGTFSGPFAFQGKAWRDAMDVYVKHHGDSVAGSKVEFVYRDLPEPNPAQAKALAQELVIREKVQYLGGFVFTPDALAVAPLAEQAKIPTVIFNAATSSIIDKSKYLLRTSYTLPQVAVPAGVYAAEKGYKNVVTMVTDYAPGVDAESAFKRSFTAVGGTVPESIRMPLATADFGPFLQRAKALKPDAIFTFLPGGPPTFAFAKAYHDNGMRQAGVAYLGTGETQEFDLQQLGPSAEGLETVFFYSGIHPSPLNDKFKKTLAELHADGIANPLSMEAYDGLHVIYKMIEATKGERNPDKAVAAVKGLAWESPRGPVKIDPETRDFIQNIYVRRVVRDTASGLLVNQEIRTYEMQPDYGRQGTPLPSKK